MSDIEFSSDAKNPLTELSELRLELSPDNDDGFDLMCQLRMGVMTVEIKDREYEVGVSQAYLHLSLEGFQTTIGNDLGDCELSVVEEERSFDAGIGVSGDVSSSGGQGALGAKAAKQVRQRQSSRRLPVRALPNQRWEIKPVGVAGDGADWIDGTPIPGKRLCKLQRKGGGNRLSLIGELQVKKRAIKVQARGGNAFGKAMALRQNQDTVIAKVIEKAMQREASTVSSTSVGETVVVSRTEVTER